MRKSASGLLHVLNWRNVEFHDVSLLLSPSSRSIIFRLQERLCRVLPLFDFVGGACVRRSGKLTVDAWLVLGVVLACDDTIPDSSVYPIGIGQ